MRTRENRYFSVSLVFRLFIIISLIGLLFYWVIPLLKRLKENQESKTKVNQLENQQEILDAENGLNSVEIQKKKIAVVKKKYSKLPPAKIKEYSTAAQRIASALGTDVANERHLFGIQALPLIFADKFDEDEETVVQTLTKYPFAFDMIADFYQNVYTRGRNLKTDLYKYLSKSDIARIKTVHKKYKVVNL